MASSSIGKDPEAALLPKVPSEPAVTRISSEGADKPAVTVEAAVERVDPAVATILETEAPVRPPPRAVRGRARFAEAAEEGDEEEGEEEDEEEGSDVNPLLLNGAICLGKGVGAALSGGVMGAVWGVGSGLFKREGFKPALAAGGKSAKTFAILGGVHSAVTCSLQSLRGDRETWHAGVAGCATGLVIGSEAGPQSALQSCAGFGVFSYLVENLQPQAVAAPHPDLRSMHNSSSTRHVDRLAHVEFPQTPAFLEPVVRPVRRFHTRLRSAESRRVKEAIRRELRR